MCNDEHIPICKLDNKEYLLSRILSPHLLHMEVLGPNILEDICELYFSSREQLVHGSVLVHEWFFGGRTYKELMIFWKVI